MKKTTFITAKLVLALAMTLATLTASAQTDPRTMTADYYMSQPFTPDTEWHFSPAKYSEMEFYRPGKAHVEIEIDGITEENREEIKSISVSGEEQILRRDITLTAQLDERNRFVFDIDLPGALTVFFESVGNIFVQPGDTLEVFAKLEPAPYINIRQHAFRSNSETAMINALRPKMFEKLAVAYDGYHTMKRAVQEGKESADKLAEEWDAVVENILTSEDIRQTLINTPLSTFGKDIVMTYAITEMGLNLEELSMYYPIDEHIHEKDADGKVTTRENPEFAPRDKEKITAVLLRHRELFYDNPLVLSTGWTYVNRTVFSPLFRNHEEVKVAEHRYDYRLYDKNGMKGTFMYDIAQSQNFASRIESLQEEILLGNQQASEVLDIYNFRYAENLAVISYTPVAKAVIDEYRAVVARLKGGKKEADEDKWTADQCALWKKITAPFEGNLLFVDFWGMSCGPCRSGMMSMRGKVEALKDDPIRFLYVCDEKHSPRAEAEQWMAENSIRGEHIYVTHDEWNQLETMFNFTGIPHAVLADKNGKVIQNGFQIFQHSAESLRSIAKRY